MCDTGDIGADELLFRSVYELDIEVSGEEITHLSSQAFADKSRQVSVDRAHLVDHDPRRSRMAPTDGVVVMRASDVRGLGPIQHNDTLHTIELRPDMYPGGQEAPARPAHALIFGIPEFERRGFDKLRQRLKGVAQLALAPNADEAEEAKALERVRTLLTG